MKVYLLDTCTFIWLCAEPSKLSPTAREVIDASGNQLVLSDVSALEISMKWGAGKLRLPDPPRHWIEAQVATWSLTTRGIDREDIYRSAELPEYHRDPFDRLLVASAINANASVLTPDSAIREYPVSCRW